MIKERVYISGPMTGLEREEYNARFMRAEQLLREEGYKNIVNPVRFLVNRWPWLFRLMVQLAIKTYRTQSTILA